MPNDYVQWHAPFLGGEIELYDQDDKFLGKVRKQGSVWLAFDGTLGRLGSYDNQDAAKDALLRHVGDGALSQS